MQLRSKSVDEELIKRKIVMGGLYLINENSLKEESIL
jgi:hypothetical protein